MQKPWELLADYDPVVYSLIEQELIRQESG